MPFSGQEPRAFWLMFRPQRVEIFNDTPEDLAKSYPNTRLVFITFKPLAYAAATNGSNLQTGEGSWLDRGMKPTEPGKIRFLVPNDEPNRLVHTLKSAAGPFIVRVQISPHGYMETIPLFSPHLDLVAK